MEKNRDIANGFTTNRLKEDVQKFWKNVESDLNCLGPPIKSVAEWKKVWLDKKKYVRKKMSDNLRQRKATGGGPNKEYKFSSLDETIIRICAMGESVEGCQNAYTFGLPSCSKKRKLDVDQNNKNEKENCSFSSTPNRSADVLKDKSFEENVLMDILITSPEPEAQHERHTEQEESETINTENKIKTPRLTKERQKGMTTQAVLEKEIEIQKELCNKFEEAVSAMKHHQEVMESSFKKIYRSIDKVHDHQKKTLEETKRHNIEMEKMRMQEIKAKLDFKKRLLEIEEAKLEKLN